MEALKPHTCGHFVNHAVQNARRLTKHLNRGDNHTSLTDDHEMNHVCFRDDALYLGTQYFTVIRSALRRDIALAGSFFGIPEGQVGYVIGSISRERLLELAGLGLPYRMPGLDSLAIASSRMELANKGFQHEDLTEWQKGAFDLACDHWWIVRGWARENPGLAAVMCGITTHAAMQAIAQMRSSEVRELAKVTYDKMQLESCISTQMAFLFADAEASPDRIAVARAGCRIAA